MNQIDDKSEQIFFEVENNTTETKFDLLLKRMRDAACTKIGVYCHFRKHSKTE